MGFPGFEDDAVAFDPGLADEAVQEKLPNTNDADSAVRTEFPETWLWMEATVGVDGMLSIETTVPDTITSWVGSAFALSSFDGLGIVPTTSMVTVFKPFFVSINLPYSVIRGENLALEILVFNYQTMDITAEIKLHKSEDFDNIEFHTGGNSIDDKVTEVYVSKDQVVKANIPAGEGVSVSYAIIPKNLKLMDIQVTAQSTNGRDSVIRQLLVEPEGVTEFYTNADLIDLTETDNSFTNSFLIDLPPNGLVDGSVYVKLATTGDIMAPTMSGLDELLRMPYGCGEQNMIFFAPDVFIYDYLTNTNQNNPEIKKKALDFMKIGYQRELNYKHKDGSFSAFGNRDPSGSTWLTAFVIKSFVQAQDYIFVDNKVVEMGIIWLLEQQNTDGSFMEPGKICDRDMQGGVSGPVTITAYVVVAIQEAKNGRGLKQATLDGLTRSLDKANAYIVGQFYTFNRDPYILAITTYALTLSGHAQRDTFLTALEALAIVEGGMKYWRRQDKNTADDESNGNKWFRPYGKPPSSDVEMTGYGLLTYLARDNTLGGASISKWLTTQRSEIGGYSSTQDTVVALQALASYAGKISVNRGEVVIDVTLSEDPTYNQSLIVNSDNALVFQQLEIPASSGSVDVSASGIGSFILQFSVMYNVQEVVEEPAFNVTIAVIDNDLNNIQIQVCGQYLKDIVQSGMSIMEIGIPSGFVVDEDRIRHELEDIASLQNYEFQKRSAILYLDEIAFSFPTCVGVAAYRTNLVSNIKPSPVKLYNYYQPDEQVTTFYLSNALSKSNIHELCDTCGKAIRLSAADTTPEPSAAVIQMTPHPLLNIATLIMSCFITGLLKIKC
ncbi:CD109 antigen-like [Antedon mediterranea]|uniref:CD109 antigen-like n=1 Tax=Antedon mediterranea TaxID=105859 RepID=UPI003AF556DA